LRFFLLWNIWHHGDFFCSKFLLQPPPTGPTSIRPDENHPKRSFVWGGDFFCDFFCSKIYGIMEIFFARSFFCNPRPLDLLASDQTKIIQKGHSFVSIHQRQTDAQTHRQTPC
jgi:hypothetical protein